MEKEKILLDRATGYAMLEPHRSEGNILIQEITGNLLITNHAFQITEWKNFKERRIRDGIREREIQNLTGIRQKFSKNDWGVTLK